MKLTRASGYALHAIAYMAQQKHDKPVASHHIAQARGIPERFLLKVLKPLVGINVLRSVKGPNGGYQLARSPNQVTVLEVVEAVDGEIKGVNPFAHRKVNIDGPVDNKLADLCQQTAQQVRKQLAKVRLSDLVAAK
jgi:Rrf2 family protein